jgi:hypothetical protein
MTSTLAAIAPETWLIRADCAEPAGIPQAAARRLRSVMRHRVSARVLRELPPGVAATEGVCELGQRREHVHETQSRHRPANEIVRQDIAHGRQRFDEVIAVPECRPRNQDQQEACFEQEGDEQQASEQSSPFGLDRCKPLDPVRHITKLSGCGFGLDKHCERARVLARTLERVSQMNGIAVERRHSAYLAIGQRQAVEQRRGPE